MIQWIDQKFLIDYATTYCRRQGNCVYSVVRIDVYSNADCLIARLLARTSKPPLGSYEESLTGQEFWIHGDQHDQQEKNNVMVPTNKVMKGAWAKAHAERICVPLAFGATE